MTTDSVKPPYVPPVQPKRLFESVSLEDIPKILPLLSEAEREQLLLELDKLDEMKRRKAAQDRFMPFVRQMWPTFISGRHHAKMAEAFEKVASGEIKRLIINMPPRHCLRVDTPLLTTQGWKTMATVEPGDFVFGPDGRPTEVLGKSEVHTGRKLWRVADAYGNEVFCDDGHIWNVASCRKRPVFKNKTAKALGERTAERRVWVPDHAPLEFPEADLPVDPYTLGVWLGDGAALQATVTMSDVDAAPVRARIEQGGYETKDRTTRYTFGVSGLKVQLRELGVLGNKHIPAAYFRGSIQQRLSLLHGLMDTDGNVTKQGQCFLATSSPVLKEQYLELLWGLGIKTGVATSRAMLNGRDYGETYRLGFYHDNVSTLERKQSRATGYKKVVRRYISLERAGTGDVQCIEVARGDGLFLAGHALLVTHNTKSEFASYLLPAWFLGKFPHKKVIQTSHTAELAVGFGRKVRNLVDTEVYHDIFPDLQLQSDSKAAGRWNTSKQGDYFAIGVGGAVTGKGADLLIIDDPHSEQEAALAEVNPEIYDKTYEWYTSGPRQRLQPGGSIIVVMTRWSKRDLTARVLEAAAQRGGEEWTVIEFPAILPSGNPLWPEFWPLPELQALKEELPNSKWSAQYLQNPVSEASAIIKREWWQKWPSDVPPDCEFTLMAWDTAFEKTQRADYSAQTTWGVFYQADDTGVQQANIILLNAFRERMEFPKLKQTAIRLYKEWEPDSVIVEKKASGSPLIYEMRAMGIPVQEFTPTRGNDKISRLNAIADIFASGRVWAPNTSWAEEVIEEVASFPAGSHDDYTDTVSMALSRFRKGGYVGTQLDEPEEQQYFKRKAQGYY